MYIQQLKSLFSKLCAVLLYVCVLGPFVWTLLISLQGAAEVNSSYALLLPRKLHLDNYLAVLTNRTVSEGLLNSLIISLLSAGINVLVSVPAGFVLARIPMRLSKVFIRIIMMVVFVPILLLTVPVRDMLIAAGLRNTYLMAALPMSAMVMTVITFWSYYSHYPREMDDCAMMLGMTPIHSFFRIYLPASGKIAVCAGVTQFITTWNCSFLPLFMYRTGNSINVIQESLLQFSMIPSRIFLGMVAVIVTCLPCWILYMYAMKHAQYLERKV